MISVQKIEELRIIGNCYGRGFEASINQPMSY